MILVSISVIDTKWNRLALMVWIGFAEFELLVRAIFFLSQRNLTVNIFPTDTLILISQKPTLCLVLSENSCNENLAHFGRCHVA